MFSLYSAQLQATEIDLFVEGPLDFAQAYRSAVRLEVVPGVAAPFVGYDDLVELKKRAGRPQDVVDLERLRGIRVASEE